MKKFSIESKTIILNKEKINIISLENKNDKFIIYSDLNIQEDKINKDLFTKMEFYENIQILPKKKFNDLKFTVELNKENNMYNLLKDNNVVYYLNNNKNIIINNNRLKLILSNGNLYSSIKEQPKNNLVDNILSNSKKNIVDNLLKNNDLKKNLDIIKEEDIVTKNVTEKQIINQEKEFVIQKEEVFTEEELNVSDKEDIVSDKEESEKVDVLEKEEVSTEEDDVLEKEEVILEKVDISSCEITVPEKEDIKHILYIPPIEIIHPKVIQENNVLNDIKTNIVKDNITNIENNIKNITFKNSNDNIINNDIKIIKENNSEELQNKKDKLDSEIFNLENILSDFNKLFHSIGTKQDTEIKNVIKNTANQTTSTNIENKPVIKPITISNNKTKPKIVNNEQKVVNNEQKVVNNEQKIVNNKSENIQNIYTVKINYQNIIYRLNTIKLAESTDLNFSNLFKSKIHENNIVNKFNLSYELEKHNSSYIFSFFNQKYLINKINNSIVLTNLLSRNSQIIKNKENFKIGNYDFILFNECTIIIPMLNKKIFDNNYGTSYNLYVPRI